MKKLACILFYLLLPAFVYADKIQQAKVFSYPLPSIYQKSTQFTLAAGVVEIPIVSYNDKYDYAHFAVSKGQFKISISLTDQEIKNYNISPKKLGINGQVKGNQLTFDLNGAAYLIVKINNKRELVIAIDQQAISLPKPVGKGIFNVDINFKADKTGKTLTTSAIQKAIDAAATFINGTIYVPAGVYLIGNLELKSNISVYFEPGAVFLFSGRAEDYTAHARKASQNRNITWWIYTKAGAKNINLYGAGTLDGNGKIATEKGNIGNHILAIMGTENFVMDGLIIRNSGAWAVLPIRSQNVKLLNFKLFNRFDMGENDGVDVIESENVLVKHAIGIALDDPFSTKTWKQDTDLCRNWPGKPLPQKNVAFEDCISWTYCYGFKIGQGIMQPQTAIKFKNCVVYDAAVGIGIHHKWGASYVKNVVFDGIDIERLSYQNDDHRTWAIFFMQNGDKLGSGPISDILVRNIKVRDAGRSPVKIKGINEVNSICDLTFKNVVMPNQTQAAQSLKEMNITDITFSENIKVKP
ncbi:coagulation factor 5/8 type domain-containing protein [Pedobacter polaris]|uniref:Coagulation factor 5/8 type domain-containing protein n=1 Tax=Pedobacter polaris TaxID=2571273 RepID=A0A4U1CZ48_9SPHI|nr:glycosyl hydrolase family 28 protein [Pedobacter polaris]TKC12778.1 coagulation factor 5/8 type domain-containing protein [Pedobacter polaris]